MPVMQPSEKLLSGKVRRILRVSYLNSVLFRISSMKALDKRGEAEELETITLFDIILGIMVAAFLIIATVSFSGLSSYGKVYLESDLSFLTGAVLSAPGDIIIRYPISPDYKIEMCDKEIQECDKIIVHHEPSALGSIRKELLVFEASPAEVKRPRREEA